MDDSSRQPQENNPYDPPKTVQPDKRAKVSAVAGGILFVVLGIFALLIAFCAVCGFLLA